MSSGVSVRQQSSSRKRPVDGGGGDNDNDNNCSSAAVPGLRSAFSSNNHRAANQAQEYKRRQILQESWGLREVLAECGLLDFAPPTPAAAAASSNSDDDNGDISNENNNIHDDAIIASSSELGCQLDPNVSPSTLRSSIHALLSEMSRNGIDPNNTRILKDLEDMVIGSGSSNGEHRSGDGGTSSLLRRMLLPLYRVRDYARGKERGDQQQQQQPYYDFSQFSQPDVFDGSNGTATKKVIAESSSLIRVLLRVDALQPTLLSALMQKLPELAMPPSADHDGIHEEEEDVPRLIFSNMRWLDHIVDYPSLTNAFVECLTILASSSSSCSTTKNVLLDAIATLPDVLNDSIGFYCDRYGGSDDDDERMNSNEGDGSESSSNNSSPILSTLQLLRVEDPTLLVPCLDAIGSLPLTENQMDQVMHDALEALSNVDSSGLPALTTFVMNHCPKGTTEMAKEVIEEMRKLPLGSNGGSGTMVGGGRGDDEGEDSFGHSSDNRNSAASSSSAASSCLTIESLSRGFAHRPDLTSALLKSIKETPLGGYHPPADIWLLACCAFAPHNRPKVKSIFKSKASSGMFTSRLLRESLSGNGVALTSLFGTSLCDLADGLLRGSSSTSPLSDAGGGRAACELGVTLYEVLFDEFSEPMHRQEIVGSLVTHVGSGVNVNPAEVDAALRVFCGIIDKSADGAMALRPFTPFLTSMLDHLHHLTPYQVRRLFLILFAVGDGDQGDEGAAGMTMRGGACDVVQIVIRKHLSLTPFAMKRIGIIGSVAFAVSRSSLVEVGQVGAAGATFYPSNTAVASSPVIQEIKDMIMSAYSSCKPSTLSTRPDGNVDNTMGAARRFRNSTVSAGGSPVFVGSSMAFLLDELGHAVRGRRLATQIKEWINDMIMEDFEAWFVGDFDDSACPPGTKGNNENTNGETPSIGMPKSSADLAILNGNSIHNSAPPGEFRFDVEGTDSAIYVKILPLLASHDRAEREFLPVQLSPMFRLTTLLADCRYGGEGIDQVDAVLECPIFLPSQASSGMEFEDLSPRKQWVVTSSYYFVTCWIRQLINSFIDAADGSTAPEHSSGAPSGTSMSSASSQRMNSADVQKAIIARLGALVEVEEELAFTASKCYNFAPPGLDILPPPKVLTGSALENTDENRADTNVESTQATKENKKANTEAKKRAAQMKKAKQKHEEMLVQRTFGTIRQLDPQVCVALGFGDLSIMGSTNACEGSQGLSQFPQVTTCGGPVTMMLLKLMKRVLSEILHNKKHQSHFEGGPVHDADEDNPYATTIHQMSVIGNFTDIALASCESSTRNCFALLNRFLWSGAFASLYEHLAAVAELRCGVNRKVDDSDLERRLVETARCLFSCIESVMGSEMLTSSATGRTFLCSILKQIAEGDRTDYSSNGTKRNRISTSTMKTLMGFISDNVNEIIVGAYTGDLVFAMDGVNCMQAIFKCSQRISDSHRNCEDSTSSLSQKLFAASEKLLRQSWPDDTKLNKGNVGVLLSLFVEHSPDRMKTLSYLVEDVLHEVISLEKSEAVHDFSTCSPQTLGYFHSTALRFLVLEIEELFSSPLGNTKDPTVATGTLELLKRMTSLLQSMSAITNMHSTKKFLILQHLKLGTRYLETFVLKAVPFFQVHFREHQESILDIIRCVQTWSRGLYHIISHGKRKKEAMVAKEAPRANKALEMFIHKVKAMLKKNNCMTAMWTKSLKSKGVDGKKLSSEDEDDESDGEGACSSSLVGNESDSESVEESDDDLNTDDDSS